MSRRVGGALQRSTFWAALRSGGVPGCEGRRPECHSAMRPCRGRPTAMTFSFAQSFRCRHASQRASMPGNLSRPTGPPCLGQAVLRRGASLLVAWASAGGVLQAFHGKPGIRGRASGSEGGPISHASPALGSPTRRRWVCLGAVAGSPGRPWRACWPWGFSPHDEGALGRWRGRGMAWRSIAKAVVSAQEIEGGMFIVNQGGILRGGVAKRMRANQGELRASNRGQDTRPEHAGHGHELGHEPARKPPSGRPPGGTKTSQKCPLPGASGTMRLPKNQAKPGPPVAQLALHAAPICPINRQISPEKARKTI